MAKPLAFNAAAKAAHDRRAAHERVFVASAKGGLPTSSWWLLPKTREEFRTLAAQLIERMSVSSFGRVKKLTTGKDTDQVERVD